MDFLIIEATGQWIFGEGTWVQCVLNILDIELVRTRLRAFSSKEEEEVWFYLCSNGGASFEPLSGLWDTAALKEISIFDGSSKPRLLFNPIITLIVVWYGNRCSIGYKHWSIGLYRAEVRINKERKYKREEYKEKSWREKERERVQGKNSTSCCSISISDLYRRWYKKRM